MELVVRQRHLGPRTFFACVLSVSLVQILAIDMYAPALPAMQREFSVSAGQLNYTVFSFLFTSTLAMVLAGPVSDRFGRKPPLVAGSVLFAAGSIACALAPNVEALVVFRAIEAIGCGASTTLTAAIVKDAYAGDDLKLAMTLLESLIIIGPVASPFLGSFMVTAVGWRGVFWMLAVGGLLTVAASLVIDETFDASAQDGLGLGASLAHMGRTAALLVRGRSFTALALFIGVTGVPFFAFIAVSPYILLDDFGTGYLGYSLVYAGACAVNLVAPFVYLWLSKRWRTRPIMLFTVALVAASAVAMALFSGLSPVLLLVCFAPYALAEGIARPAAYLILLDQPADRVGTASALGNFTYGVVTAFATIAATFPWPSFLFGLVALEGITAACALGLYALGSKGWN